LYAITLLVFGTKHFRYAEFVATLIPSWMPARLSLARFVGVARFACAVSIFARKLDFLGTTLLGVMFLLSVLELALSETEE